MTTVVEEHVRDVRAEVQALIDSKAESQANISKQSGVSTSALSGWLRGVYAGDNAKVESDVSKWLSHRAQKAVESKRMRPAPTWVTTPTGEKIMGALSYAHAAQDMVIVYGAAGVGKTTAVRRYRDEWPAVYVATMTPACKGVVPCLQEICEAIGVEPVSGANALHRSICKRLKGTQGLLIIDEANHLTVDALDQIRSIHDAVEIGIALVGNETVYTQMTSNTRAAYLDRLYSRIGRRLPVARATKGDVDALIGAWGIEDKGCAKQIHQVASMPGALRSMTKVLRLASTIAAANERSMCCDDVLAAASQMGGEQ